MSFETASHSKPLVAAIVRALKWLLTGVDPDVVKKFLRAFEYLAALLVVVASRMFANPNGLLDVNITGSIFNNEESKVYHCFGKLAFVANSPWIKVITPYLSQVMSRVNLELMQLCLVQHIWRTYETKLLGP